MFRRVERLIKKIKGIFRKKTSKVKGFIGAKPFISFFVLLAILLLLIVVSNLFRQTPVVTQNEKNQPRSVPVYRIGEAPKIKLQAQIEKSGVVQIFALTGGVIQKIYYTQGQPVNKGMILLWMSANYQGGNTSFVQRQIVEKQLENLESTLPQQREVLSKQREVANKTDANNDVLRDITAQSQGETRSLIDLNNQILNTLNQNLADLNAGNVGGVNDDEILLTQQLKSQFQSANNQLSQTLRNAEYQSGGDNNPSHLSDLHRDMTLRQLDIQEKSLNLNVEITKLQLKAARIAESASYPSAPFKSTVQKVFVREGQFVQPGTPLLTLAQAIEDDPITAVIYAPLEIAQKVSTSEQSELLINNFHYLIYPSYVSQEAVNGDLYAIYYPVADNYSKYLTDKGYIEVLVPVGSADTSSTVPFIPLEAIFSTQNKDYVNVVVNKRAQAQEVQLGEVTGSFVVVEKGLNKGDQVILDRSVLAGEEVIPL